MTNFYDGDDKWLLWLEAMGILDPPPSCNAAQWPKFMLGDVGRAREEWKKPFHTVSDWERVVQPLYDTWLRYHLIDRANDTKRYISRLLNKYSPNSTENSKLLYDIIVDFLKKLSNDMKHEENTLGFYPELGGSISQGTKIGPMDEWDFRMVLSDKLAKHDPALKKLYTLMWQCLAEIRQTQASTNEPSLLTLVGFVINNARLPSLVFKWDSSENSSSDDSLGHYVNLHFFLLH